MRAFFADGVDKLHIPWAVEGLPALLHLSLFLFFSGVLIFLFNINHTVFLWVIWSVGVSLMMYGWITVLPIFRHDSPYYAPLSGSVWFLYTSIPYALFKVLAYFASMDCFTVQTYFRFRDLREDYYRGIVGGVEGAAEETALQQSSEIDWRILDWTLGTLGEDDLLEKFFDAIRGFINSSLVDPEGLKRDKLEQTLSWAIAGFLYRTLSSNSILDSVKSRRLIICADIAGVMDVSFAFSSIPWGVEVEQLSLPQSIETGHALARWCDSKISTTALHMRCIVARIIIAVSERDDRWIALAKDQFGLPEDVLRDNIAHGDNGVLLSILIHLTRQAIHSRCDPELLTAVARFDIHHTVPGLQHEFCALWNEIVLEARNRGDYSETVLLLRALRQAYIALHQGTMAAPTAFSAFTWYDNIILFSSSSYPLCTLASHRSDSTLDGPHSAQVETQPLPTITAVTDISITSSAANPVHTATQRAKETMIMHSPTDLAITQSENASPHTQPFPSVYPTTEPVHILPQVTSVAYPSIPTRDLNLTAPIEDSHELRQSTLSDTETAVLADPITYIHTTETRETSSDAAAISVSFPYSDPILNTAAIPSAVTSGLADVSNTFQRPTSAATLSHPQENNKEHHTAMPAATTCVSEISSPAHSIPHSIPGGGATLDRDEEATGYTPIVVSRSQSSPMSVPAPPSTVIPEEVSSFIESPIQSDYTLGSPSSSATARSQIALKVTSIMDAHTTGSIRAVGGNDDTHDMETTIPMEDLPHTSKSTAPALGIDPVTLPPEDHDNDRS